MRLTLDIIRRAPQFTNTLRQREIDLRGLGLTVLDERPLLLLNNSFDVLNLSQNPLVRLEYFPSGSTVNSSIGTSSSNGGAMPTTAGDTTTVEPERKMMLRLQSLIVHRNRLSHVSVPTCAAVLPNLRAFLADHNEFRELRDLLFLSHWKQLEILSIENNPVTLHESDERLRAFVVFLCPKLKLVNYQRVTQTDRRNVETMRVEFEQRVKEWQQQLKGSVTSNGAVSGAVVGGAPTEKKMRKRGREARTAATVSSSSSSMPSGSVAPTADGPPVPAAQTATVAATGGADDVVDSTQARLEALDAKMAAAETEEELLEIQQEIMELEAAAAAATSSRARTS
ncbi:putative U2 small nuclear ribonucleoprotein 40K [Trypanosoma grayi]|uniref:putative U2 small nuclear ribonucleoprotein 40K n=1 Tax=Trypanosoma grayi TaxID=71804 RepID=UPI0004F412E8|nr:putative U2 small nuclear ribonucleoprotein 40K [Trypanosoma grayi]KEG14965.1 putative U2 small nuclear ribonucleoprotein 40K [Trypanosoma grayi]